MHPGRDLYVIGHVEDLAPLGVLVFEMEKLSVLGSLPGKRHPGQEVRIEFLEPNARAILLTRPRFASAGVTVYRPPRWVL